MEERRGSKEDSESSSCYQASSLSPNFPLIDIKKNVHQESHLGKLCVCVCLGFKAMDLRRMFG